MSDTLEISPYLRKAPALFLMRTLDKHPRYCKMTPVGTLGWTRIQDDATRFSRSDARWAHNEATAAGLSVTIEATEAVA